MISWLSVPFLTSLGPRALPAPILCSALLTTNPVLLGSSYDVFICCCRTAAVYLLAWTILAQPAPVTISFNGVEYVECQTPGDNGRWWCVPALPVLFPVLLCSLRRALSCVAG